MDHNRFTTDYGRCGRYPLPAVKTLAFSLVLPAGRKKPQIFDCLNATTPSLANALKLFAWDSLSNDAKVQAGSGSSAAFDRYTTGIQ